ARAVSQRAEHLRRVPRLPGPTRTPGARPAARSRLQRRPHLRRGTAGDLPDHLREPAEVLAGIRKLRRAGRPRGELPVLALPAHAHGPADHWHETRHRRLERSRIPPEGTRPDLLPRTL